MTYALAIHADCRQVLPLIAPDSIDALVTDPPAGISFMGLEWDSDRGGRDAWVAWLCGVMVECLRVLKPGGRAIVWALPKTAHWTAWAMENAGFLIHNKVYHLYGSGRPNSVDLGKLTGDPVWEGWGTGLKPAAEEWILATKPLDGLLLDNVTAHGVGGWNIDACRTEPTAGEGLGRWPANVTLDAAAAEVLDAQSGPVGAKAPVRGTEPSPAVAPGGVTNPRARVKGKFHADVGGASRFFYVAKPGRSEKGKDNQHKTVKPVTLTDWFVRLASPPRGGVILDPFMGSGTTAVSSVRAGVSFIGVDVDAASVQTSRSRIDEERRRAA